MSSERSTFPTSSSSSSSGAALVGEEEEKTGSRDEVEEIAEMLFGESSVEMGRDEREGTEGLMSLANEMRQKDYEGTDVQRQKKRTWDALQFEDRQEDMDIDFPPQIDGEGLEGPAIEPPGLA